MTDAEIIKALECCCSNNIDSCEECPIKIECYTETIDCKKEALDLINRQKAEIERLQKENNQFADIGKMYSEIKAEAIKEFAERVKKINLDTVLEADHWGYEYPSEELFCKAVDNLVKEHEIFIKQEGKGYADADIGKSH